MPPGDWGSAWSQAQPPRTFSQRTTKTTGSVSKRARSARMASRIAFRSALPCGGVRAVSRAVESEGDGGARTQALGGPPAAFEARAEPPAAERVRFDVGMSLADLEREAIRRTLESVAGNRRRAADILGIGERTLYRKLREYQPESGGEVPA